MTILLAWGRSEPFQGSWAYLGPCGVTSGAIAQFLGAWEARKKRGVFLILACIHTSTKNFQELNLGKALFLPLPPRYTALALWRVINFSKEALSLFSLCSYPSTPLLNLKPKYTCSPLVIVWNFFEPSISLED
jgi:hypothetical protein